MARTHCIFRTGLALCALAIFTVSSASADSVASIPDSGDDRARSSFDDFAKTWMNKMRETEASHRQSPDVRRAGQSITTTYRGLSDDFTIELRPTGHPNSPFIGILRYTEHVYSCRTASKCSVASTSPVTEIFRYQSGRWVY